MKGNGGRGGKNVWLNDKTLNLICLRGVVNPESKDLMWPLVHLSLQNVPFKSWLLSAHFAVMFLLKRCFGKTSPGE